MDRVANIAILGASGSIGKSAAAVIAADPGRFRLIAAAARSSRDELLRQTELLKPSVVALTDRAAAETFRRDLPAGVKLLSGDESLVEIATLPEVDIVLCAVVGGGGLKAVLAALKAGKRVALASKEVLVTAGDIVNSIGSGELIPVDSEHSGIFQCLAGRSASEVSKVTLTASGGPFRTWSAERIAKATYADAVRHPVWEMGEKVSIDSATLMNKGLELIEAKHLFHLAPEQIDAVIHPQSVVHALVELCDGSALAQLSNPDMKLAIQYAFSYPERAASVPAGRLDLAKIGALEFFAPDETRFPALKLARRAMVLGGCLPAVLTAANDAAVELFKAGKIAFDGIWQLTEAAMDACRAIDDGTLESRFAADAEARRFVAAKI